MLILHNCQIIDVVKQAIYWGEIWIHGKKIYKVTDPSEGIENGEHQYLDLNGAYVMPGMIDAHTHLGIMEEVYRIEGDDGNEATDPVTPYLRAIDAINPLDRGFQDAYMAGITTIGTGPGSANVLGGQCAVIKTYGKVVDKMVLRAPAGVKAALGENPKRNHGEQKRSPATRMATAAIMREAFIKADNYRRKQAKEPDTERDFRLEALVQTLEKAIPIKIHAHRADDIMTGVRIAKEFKLDIVLIHATEGHKLVEELVELKAPVVVGPMIVSRAKVELEDRQLQTAGILAKAGVKVAITTDHPVVPINYLSLCAALAAKHGMDQWAALQAITISGAEILGVADQVGSIQEGKDADLVILDGNPLELSTKVLRVMINGKFIAN